MERRFLPVHVREGDLLTFWRERILFGIVFTVTVLGFFALIPSLVLSAMEKRWDIFLLDLTVYGGALAILFGRRMPLAVRAWAACSIFFSLGVGLLFMLGPLGAGYIWLFGASVMAGLLIGFRVGLWSLVLNFASLLTIGWFIAQFQPDWSKAVENPLEKWLVMTANFMVINSLIAIATALMLRALVTALTKEQEIGRNLRHSEERFRLIVENLPILIAGQDRENRLVLWNKACERVTGYTAEEMISRDDPNALSEANIFATCASLLDINQITAWNSSCLRRPGIPSR